MNIHTTKTKENYAIKVKAVQNPQDAPTGPALVYIENSRIREIIHLEQSADFLKPKGFSDEVEVLDYSDAILCPGLIDAHIHMSLDGVDFSSALARWDQPIELSEYLRQVSDGLLAGGIVLARDGGDKAYISFHLHEDPAIIPAPKILSPGEALRKVGMYGSFLGAGVNNIADIKSEIERLHLLGVDLIKLVITGIVSFREYGKIGPVQFTPEELSVVVAEAHARDLPVMAHVNGDTGVKLALQAGVDSIEHGYFMSPDTIKRLADAQIPWVPTVIPLAAQLDSQHQGNWSQEEQRIIRHSYQLQLENIAYAHQQGAVLGLGSDAGAIGVLHGYSLHQELALLNQAGLASQELFYLATQGNAQIMGQAVNYGTIAPGKLGAMVAVTENPRQNIGTLREPLALFLPEL